MKEKKQEDKIMVTKDIELVERMASVAEELEDLIKISKDKRNIGSPLISRDDLMTVFKKTKTVTHIPISLLAIFRLFVVKNLVRGRLFTTTYASGKEIGLSASVKSIKEFEKVVRRIGVGKVAIDKFEPDTIKIRLYNGITSLGVKKSHRPICFFEAGVFSGLFENIFRKKIDLKETQCRTMGAPYCCFELSRAEYKGRKSYPLYPLDVYSLENLKMLTSLAAHSVAAIENALLFEETKKQVVIDSLTKVYNHRYFQTRINTEYRRANRYKTFLTLFMLDVDDFKKFNDKYGHPRGDEILKMVGETLINNLRDVDIVARYGGDEFAVILPQTDGAGARIVAARLRNEISKKRIAVGKRKVNITISLGGISLGPKAVTGKAAAMIEAADKALLRTKKTGKNNMVLLSKV
jgi:diguanylate cyclase (GGDEF)-like protein